MSCTGAESGSAASLGKTCGDRRLHRARCFSLKEALLTRVFGMHVWQKFCPARMQFDFQENSDLSSSPGLHGFAIRATYPKLVPKLVETLVSAGLVGLW